MICGLTPSRTLEKITIGKVVEAGPAVKLAITRSSSDKVKASYEEQTDVRYAAARLWVDRILLPENTRSDLLTALEIAVRFDSGREFKTGVLQV